MWSNGAHTGETAEIGEDAPSEANFDETMSIVEALSSSKLAPHAAKTVNSARYFSNVCSSSGIRGCDENIGVL